MTAAHSYGSMMPIVASNNSSGGSGDEDWNPALFIDNASHYMEIAFGGFLTLIGAIGVVSTVFSIQRALVSKNGDGEDKVVALVKALVSGTLIAAGVTLIRSSLNDVQETSNADPSETPTLEPEPAPPADPTPAPETHNGPDITIDSTAAIIIAATIAIIALIIAIVIFTKRRKAIKFAREAQMTAIKRDIDYAHKHIIAVSAQYAQAHTDPEYVLYKPLILSDADCVYEFNDKLMHARGTLEECEQMLKRGKPADLEFIETTKLRGLADSLDRDWRELNRKAEQVGTPLLDAGQLRRAETLWAMATNEAATVHERGRAMDKLQDIVVDCRETLTQNMNNYDTVTKKGHSLPWAKTAQPAAIPAHIRQENKQNTQLLDAIAHAIATGQKRGIITAPQHVAQLTKLAQLALTTSDKEAAHVA